MYNFDQIIDRRNTSCVKYDNLVNVFGSTDILPMWVADMDFKTAQPIIDALKEKAEEGIWGYTSRPDSYFKAICSWQERRNGWTIDPKLASWSLGVVPALAGIMQVFTKPGDKILIQTPVYSEFYDITEALGRQVVENRLTEQDGVWSIDFEDFEKKAREASRSSI